MVTTISEQVFGDGGYAASFKSQNWIFGINYIAGEIRVHRVSGGPKCFGNRALALRTAAQTRAIECAVERISALPREWHDSHRALYKTV